MRLSYRRLTPIIVTVALAGLLALTLLVVLGDLVALPAHANGSESCFATPDDGATLYSSANADAVQSAVDATSAGSVIKIAGTCVGVQSVGGQLQTVYIDKNMTLRGGYTTADWTTSAPATFPTTLSADQLGRVVLITGTADVQLDSLIVRDGVTTAGAGLLVGPDASLSLLNSHVLSNTAISSGGFEDFVDGSGGGLGNLGQTTISGTIFSDNVAPIAGAVGNGPQGRMTVTGSTFRDNRALDAAGAVGNTGWMTITAGSFVSNTAVSAGAIGTGIFITDAPGWMHIANSTFLSNTAEQGGGAIENDGGTLQVVASHFEANLARQGGAIYNNIGWNNLAPTLTVTNSNFLSNTAQSYGGAIRNKYGTSVIVGSTIGHNTVAGREGGGVQNDDAPGNTMTIINTRIFSNTAARKGGGISSNATLILDGVEITGNSALSSDGGGISTGSSGVFTATHTTIARNIAADDGGGLFNDRGAATLINSTISLNQALGNSQNLGGGGVSHYDDGAHLRLIHTTIVSNTSNAGGDGLFVIAGQAVLTNTLIAFNGTENCGAGGSGSFVSGGYNLEDGNTCALTSSTDMTDTVPSLGPLADNGGETPTHALLIGSPGIDAIPSGNCPVSDDQRGISRPRNTACDVGAFEYAETADVTFVKAVDGGDASPSDWTFDVDGGPTGIAHNATETINIGTFTVTESGPDGYTATGASGACSLSNGVISLTVTASGGGDVGSSDAVGTTCTITNTRDTGDVTFVKAVEGGDAQPSDWTFDVSDGGPTGIAHNATEAINTGTYTVTESGPDGYTATGASGACSLTDGVISLTVTESGGGDPIFAAGSLGATCTITNSLRTDTVASATGAGDVTYTVDACAIDDFSAVAEATLPTTGKPDIDFAYGFFGLTLEGCDVGGTANITVTLPSNLPTGSQFWKHQNDIWFQHPFASDDGDNVISFSLTDGGAGDADGTANGVIVDPAGPGITAAGVILTESFGVTDLDEDGSPVGRACYWVTLASAPSADVTITPSPDGQVTVQPTSLVLNSSNWDALGAKSNKICVRPVQDDATEGTPDAFCAAKKVDIYGTGADDVQVCGSHLGHVDHTVTSSDTNYNGADVSTTGPDLDSDTSTIDVLIRDDDTAGLIFTPGALNVLEGGNVSYNVALRSQPKDTVSVSAAQASALTFTPVTWNIPQTMTLTLPDDSEANGIRTAGIRHDVGSSDSVYAGLGETVVTLPMTVTDDDAAGAVVNHGAMALAEGGASASYGLRLTVAPGADVVITVVSGSQVSATPAQLTFTPENWNQEQTVTLTAVDDAVDEGDTADVRIGHTAGSSDVAYDNVAIAQLTARVTDNDTAAVAVGQAAQASIVEGGATTYPVTLATQPTAPVRLFVVTDGKTTATPDVLIFDAATWNVAQTVTLTGLDDAVDNAADARTSLVTHAAVSADAAYDGIADEELTVDVVDNDVAAVLLSQSEMELAQGSRASYSVSLATEPLSPVLVSLSASGVTVDASCGAAASTAPCLRFTPENWNTPQAVDVTALSGALGFVEHRTISADAAYNGRILHLTVNGVGLESVFLPLVTR